MRRKEIEKKETSRERGTKQKQWRRNIEAQSAGYTIPQ